MAIIAAFQAEDRSSNLRTRSISHREKNENKCVHMHENMIEYIRLHFLGELLWH